LHPIEKLSDDPWLETTYWENPEAIDINEFFVVTNAVLVRKDIVPVLGEQNGCQHRRMYPSISLIFGWL